MLRAATYFVADFATSARFYKEVMAFRHAHPNKFVNGMELCDVILKTSPDAPSAPGETISPILPTIAVSNLKTSKRLVIGRGGSVVDMPEDAAAAFARHAGVPFDPAQFAWCVASDPSGNSSVLVHKFRRNCIISFSLPVASLDKTAGAVLCPPAAVCQLVPHVVPACPRRFLPLLLWFVTHHHVVVHVHQRGHQ